MASTAARLARMIVVGVTVIVGWFIVLSQAAGDGWVNGGTIVLLTCAVIATAGAVLAYRSLLAERHGWAALGLALVTVSPTVFAYPLNLIVLILAMAELTIAIRLKRRNATRADRPTTLVA